MALASVATLLLLSSAVTAAGPNIPPIHVIGSPPDVKVPDIQPDVDLVFCSYGDGAGVYAWGNGEEACLLQDGGPNGGLCVRTTTVVGQVPTAVQFTCQDQEGSHTCASAYSVSGVILDDRTCEGSYPEGYCVVNTVGPGDVAREHLCRTQDYHGNECIALHSDVFAGQDHAWVRVCAGSYPDDGRCVTTRTQGYAGSTSTDLREVRACEAGLDEPCVIVVDYSGEEWALSQISRHTTCLRSGTDAGDVCLEQTADDSWAADDPSQACVTAPTQEPCVSFHGGEPASVAGSQQVCRSQVSPSDGDGDGIPDVQEVLCANNLQQLLLETLGGAAGRCTAPGAYEPFPRPDVLGIVEAARQEAYRQWSSANATRDSLVAFAGGVLATIYQAWADANATVDGALDPYDGDNDYVPDVLEQWICLVEFQTTPVKDLDGSCNEANTDYYPLLPRRS
ncbi:MAG TPA: hypothetical protein VM327_10200 [Candidatus Thermoplasmatota archaeon]|nr:hypothetical protein [Candidatus Thermoplasmatota archaeon]